MTQLHILSENVKGAGGYSANYVGIGSTSPVEMKFEALSRGGELSSQPKLSISVNILGRWMIIIYIC